MTITSPSTNKMTITLGKLQSMHHSTLSYIFLLQLLFFQLSYVKHSACIHNILFGKIFVDYHGTIPIQSMKGGESATIDFKKSGWFGGSNYEISGEARSKDGTVRYLTLFFLFAITSQLMLTHNTGQSLLENGMNSSQ